MKKLLVALAMLASASTYAGTGTITKNAKPGNMYGNGWISYSRMGILSSDFPSGTLNLTKTITSVQYTWYPYVGPTSQQAWICYDTPYQTTQGNCLEITGAQTGTTTFYNTFQFDAGSTFYIKHQVFGGTYPMTPPATADQVKVTYSY